jgi:hypothetical protein
LVQLSKEYASGSLNVDQYLREATQLLEKAKE